MEFWGVEVKPGESVKCDPEDAYIHLSQAALGEVKKDRGAEVLLFVKANATKMVIGTLAAEKIPQISYDLVFENEFELSHNGKSSVYFCGYKSVKEAEEFDDFPDSDEDSEDDQIAALAVNGKPDAKTAKPAVAKAGETKSDSKPKAKAELVKAEKAKEEKDDEDDDDDDDDEFDEDDSGSDEDMVEAGESDEDDDDDEDDSSEDEKEATPKKVETGKKRANESAVKTPGPDKKAKLATQSGGDGKKGGHTATPHPNKAGAKTPANGGDKSKQTPKSGGQVACKSCSKTFNSDAALQSHTKAKHSAGK